jgi:Asp-tRNA(Asn)/Glu-tRNA(Gln) amidotransferase B subunit
MTVNHLNVPHAHASLLITAKMILFEVFRLINDLSDHDAQYLVLNNIFKSHKSNKLSIKKRIIPKDAIATFIAMLNN